MMTNSSKPACAGGVLAGALSLSISPRCAARSRALPLPVDELRAFAEYSAISRTTSSLSRTRTDYRGYKAEAYRARSSFGYLDQDAFKELQVGTQASSAPRNRSRDGGRILKVVSPIEDTPPFSRGPQARAEKAGVSSMGETTFTNPSYHPTLSEPPNSPGCRTLELLECVWVQIGE